MKLKLTIVLIASLLLTCCACAKNAPEEPSTAADVSAAADVQIDSSILYNANDLVIRYLGKGVAPNAEGAEESYRVSIENKTENDADVSIFTSIVNGFTIEVTFNTEIDDMVETARTVSAPAGQTIESWLTVNQYMAGRCGLTVPQEIVLRFDVRDPDAQKRLFITDPVEIRTTDEALQQAYNEAGDVVYDKDGIRLIFQGVDKEQRGGVMFLMQVINTSDRDICVNAISGTVDGAVLEPWYASYVPAGSRSIETLGFSTEFHSVGTLALTFSISAYDFAAEKPGEKIAENVTWSGTVNAEN